MKTSMGSIRLIHTSGDMHPAWIHQVLLKQRRIVKLSNLVLSKKMAITTLLKRKIKTLMMKMKQTSRKKCRVLPRNSTRRSQSRNKFASGLILMSCKSLCHVSKSKKRPTDLRLITKSLMNSSRMMFKITTNSVGRFQEQRMLLLSCRIEMFLVNWRTEKLSAMITTEKRKFNISHTHRCKPPPIWNKSYKIDFKRINSGIINHLAGRGQLLRGWICRRMWGRLT